MLSEQVSMEYSCDIFSLLEATATNSIKFHRIQCEVIFFNLPDFSRRWGRDEVKVSPSSNNQFYDYHFQVECLYLGKFPLESLRDYIHLHKTVIDKTYLNDFFSFCFRESTFFSYFSFGLKLRLNTSSRILWFLFFHFLWDLQTSN